MLPLVNAQVGFHQLALQIDVEEVFEQNTHQLFRLALRELRGQLLYEETFCFAKVETNHSANLRKSLSDLEVFVYFCNDETIMSKSIIDRINYIVALITEFATAHHITTQQAYQYLQQYKGLDFVEKFYDVEHTFSFENTVEDLTLYCKRMGGNLA